MKIVDLDEKRKYRHELKYVVNQAQIALMQSRIKSLMAPDPHAGKNGSYRIRSLYFDDYKNSGYQDNISGVTPREKFRIRLYNENIDRIHMELKKKNGSMTRKESCWITEKQCKDILTGETIVRNQECPPVFLKFLFLQNTMCLVPKVIVEYERKAFVYKSGNVRVTFDTDIRSSNDLEHFLEPEVEARLIMPRGLHVLEVKYDEYLPPFIYQALQMDHLRLSSFSKYALCRKYSLGEMKYGRIW